jgi:hypothetical protein
VEKRADTKPSIAVTPTTIMIAHLGVATEEGIEVVVEVMDGVGGMTAIATKNATGVLRRERGAVDLEVLEVPEVLVDMAVGET